MSAVALLAIGDHEFFESAQVPASETRRNAASDCRNLGRRRGGAQSRRDVPRGPHSTAQRGNCTVACALAG